MTRPVWRAIHFTAPVLLAVLVGGCVVRARPVGYVEPNYQEAYVAAPPPAPVVEYRPMPPPGPSVLWVDGYWDWSGYDWFWEPGYWAPARPGYVYVRPHVVQTNGRWLYQRGYWNGHDGRRDYEHERHGRPARAAGPSESWRGYPSAPAAQGPYQGPSQGPSDAWRGRPVAPAPQGPSQGWRGAPVAPAAPPAQGPSQGWRGAPAAANPAAPQNNNGQHNGWQNNNGQHKGWQNVPVTTQAPAQPATQAPPASARTPWYAQPQILKQNPATNAPPRPASPSDGRANPAPPGQTGQQPGAFGAQRRMPAYVPPQQPDKPVQQTRPEHSPSSPVLGSRTPPRPVQSQQSNQSNDDKRPVRRGAPAAAQQR